METATMAMIGVAGAIGGYFIVKSFGAGEQVVGPTAQQLQAGIINWGQVLTQTAGTVGSTMREMIVTTREGLTETVRTIATTAQETIGGAVAAAQETMGSAISSAQETMGSAISSAQEAIDGMLEATRQSVSSMVTGAKETMQSAVSGAQGAITSAVGAARDTVSGAVGAARDTVSEVAQGVEDLAAGARDYFDAAADRLYDFAGRTLGRTLGVIERGGDFVVGGGVALGGIALCAATNWWNPLGWGAMILGGTKALGLW